MTSTLCKICKNPTSLLLDGLFDDRFGYPGKFNVFQCTKCRFVQTDANLSESELAQLYTQYYPRKDTLPQSVSSSLSYRGTIKDKVKAYVFGNQINGHTHARSGQRVLDVGCATGTSLLELKAMGADAYGTEYDENIRPVAKSLDLKIHFGDLKSVPFPDDYFDMISMSQVLEHVPDPIDFLRFAKTKLKTNGTLVMSFPNIDSRNRTNSGRKWINWHIPYHLNFFSDASVRVLAKESGFDIVSIKTVTPTLWQWFQWLVDKEPLSELKVNPVWVPEAGSTFISPTKKKLLRYAALGITPLLRGIDATGQGDSFLVKLKK